VERIQRPAPLKLRGSTLFEGNGQCCTPW